MGTALNQAPKQRPPTGQERVQMLLRGATRRCPRCGGGGLFSRWTEMHKRCETCGLNFDHEAGYWTGAMAFNIVFAELLFVVILVSVVISSWPDIPMMPLIVAGLVTNLLFPIFFYPISKTLWLAFDLSFFHAQRPRTREEIQAYAAAAAERAQRTERTVGTTDVSGVTPPGV